MYWKAYYLYWYIMVLSAFVIHFYCMVFSDFGTEPRHNISNNVACATNKASDQPARLIRAFASRLSILWILSYWPNISWSFLALKEAAQARLSLHLSNFDATLFEISCRGSWWCLQANVTLYMYAKRGVGGEGCGVCGVCRGGGGVGGCTNYLPVGDILQTLEKTTKRYRRLQIYYRISTTVSSLINRAEFNLSLWAKEKTLLVKLFLWKFKHFCRPGLA